MPRLAAVTCDRSGNSFTDPQQHEEKPMPYINYLELNVADVDAAGGVHQPEASIENSGSA